MLAFQKRTSGYPVYKTSTSENENVYKFYILIYLFQNTNKEEMKKNVNQALSVDYFTILFTHYT